MLNKIKRKFKNNTEIIALGLLLLTTILSTTYYNFNKQKIYNNYKNIINNIYFKKTLNHVFGNLEPKFKTITHKINEGETFDKILRNYEIKEEEIRKPANANDVLRIANVTVPTLSIYPANNDSSTGTSILVCPGGGYNILAYEHEGTQVCEWLNEIGITGILLKYRVPRRKNRLPHQAPLQDIQRAMGIVRENADKWGIRSDRIGVLGFSAGGNLAMMALTNYQNRKISKYSSGNCNQRS